MSKVISAEQFRKKATRIISEVEYTNENGDSVHSDLDFDFDLKSLLSA